MMYKGSVKGLLLPAAASRTGIHWCVTRTRNTRDFASATAATKGALGAWFVEASDREGDGGRR